MKGSHSFPASSRLRTSAEFQQAWQLGRRIHTQHFILIVCPNRCKRMRLGITVSRKVGNAVIRNRLKRRLREYFRRNLRPLEAFLDISIVAKRQAGSLPHELLVAELHKAFARLETESHG